MRVDRVAVAHPKREDRGVEVPFQLLQLGVRQLQAKLARDDIERGHARHDDEQPAGRQGNNLERPPHILGQLQQCIHRDKVLLWRNRGSAPCATVLQTRSLRHLPALPQQLLRHRQTRSSRSHTASGLNARAADRLGCWLISSCRRGNFPGRSRRSRALRRLPPFNPSDRWLSSPATSPQIAYFLRKSR